MSHKSRTMVDVECPKCRMVYGVTSSEVVRGTWRDCPRCSAPCDFEDDKPGDERGDGDS